MDDNLDTRTALGVLGDLADRIRAAAGRGAAVVEAKEELRKLGTVFGLRLGGETEPRVIEGWTRHYQRFV